MGILQATDGKKTYLTAALMIVAGIAGLIAGVMEPEMAGEYILGGLMAIFVRLGIAKAEKKAETNGSAETGS